MTGSIYKRKISKILVVVAIFTLYGCQSGIERQPAGTPLKLSLAVSPATYSALIAVADENGYFEKAGLDLSIDLYPSGKEALEAVCRGEAMVATAADIAFSAKIFEDSSLRVLASIGTNTGSQIVARRDRNIQKPSDLAGKKIGYSSGTVSDYFLYAFLITEDISIDKTMLVDIAPARQAEAIVNGEVDAVSAFEIFAFSAKQSMGENAVSWNSQNNLGFHWLLVTRENLTRSPEVLKRLLKALIKAEDFVVHKEEQTKNMLAYQWGFDSDFMAYSWPKNRLSVSFSQSIVISLQNYNIWQQSKGEILADRSDVLDYLHYAILEELAPVLVSIYR